MEAWIWWIIAYMLSALAMLPALRRQAHMFQLNGYKPREHRKWLSAHRGQWALLALAALFWLLYGLGAFLGWRGWLLGSLRFLVILGQAPALAYFWTVAAQKPKKDMVLTPRLCRMGIGLALCLALPWAISWVWGGDGVKALALGLQLASLPLWILWSNTWNGPMERAIQQGYINEAKRMLASMPDLTVVGITGSYGKTSVKHYLASVLEGHFSVLMTPASYNTPMGVVRAIREQLRPHHQIFLCEMGARQRGDIEELCQIVHPKHGVITSVGPQHLETFGDLSGVIATKFELARALPPEGILAVNYDSLPARQEGEKRTEVLWYGVELEAGRGYRAEILEVGPRGTRFVLYSPEGEEQEYQMSLLGAHNVANVAAALGLAHRLGVPLAKMRAGVRRLEPAPHRLQLLSRAGVSIIDDAYNSNPIGAKAALDTLALFPGCRILITPGLVELGQEEDEYNRQFGRQAAAVADYVYPVGSLRGNRIRQGLLEAGFAPEKCAVTQTLSEAMGLALALATDLPKVILLENDLPDNYT